MAQTRALFSCSIASAQVRVKCDARLIAADRMSNFEPSAGKCAASATQRQASLERRNGFYSIANEITAGCKAGSAVTPTEDGVSGVPE
jgi:hypothetical protein